MCDNVSLLNRGMSSQRHYSKQISQTRIAQVCKKIATLCEERTAYLQLHHSMHRDANVVQFNFYNDSHFSLFFVSRNINFIHYILRVHNVEI